MVMGFPGNLFWRTTRYGGSETSAGLDFLFFFFLFLSLVPLSQNPSDEPAKRRVDVVWQKTVSAPLFNITRCSGKRAPNREASEGETKIVVAKSRKNKIKKRRRLENRQEGMDTTMLQQKEGNG